MRHPLGMPHRVRDRAALGDPEHLPADLSSRSGLPDAEGSCLKTDPSERLPGAGGSGRPDPGQFRKVGGTVSGLSALSLRWGPPPEGESEAGGMSRMTSRPPYERYLIVLDHTRSSPSGSLHSQNGAAARPGGDRCAAVDAGMLAIVPGVRVRCLFLTPRRPHVTILRNESGRPT